MRRVRGVTCMCALVVLAAAPARASVVRPFAVHAGDEEQVVATADGGAAVTYLPPFGGTGYCKLMAGRTGCTAKRTFADGNPKLVAGPGHDVYLVTQGKTTQLFRSSDDGRTFAFVERLTDNGSALSVADLAFSPSGQLFAVSYEGTRGTIVAQLPLAQGRQTFGATIDTPYTDGFEIGFGGATPVVASWRDPTPLSYGPTGFNYLAGANPADSSAWSDLVTLEDSEGVPTLVSGPRGLRMYAYGKDISELRWTGSAFAPARTVTHRDICCFSVSADAVGDYDHLWAAHDFVEFQREGATAKRWVTATKLGFAGDAVVQNAQLATAPDGRHAWLVGEDLQDHVIAGEFAVPKPAGAGSPPPAVASWRISTLGRTAVPATCVPTRGKLRVKHLAATRGWRIVKVSYRLVNGRRVTVTSAPFAAAVPVSGLSGEDQKLSVGVTGRRSTSGPTYTEKSVADFTICGPEIRS